MDKLKSKQCAICGDVFLDQPRSASDTCSAECRRRFLSGEHDRRPRRMPSDRMVFYAVVGTGAVSLGGHLIGIEHSNRTGFK